MKTRKIQATSSSLNRWCLRALHRSCDAMLYNAIHSSNGAEPLAYARHQGPPPLRFSCIAPHCQEWKCIDNNTGYCCYRKNLRAIAALGSRQDNLQARRTAASQPSATPPALPA
jgi:hypothetical protein